MHPQNRKCVDRGRVPRQKRLCVACDTAAPVHHRAEDIKKKCLDLRFASHFAAPPCAVHVTTSLNDRAAGSM
jgi:hypothetical protein